ncbi:hypothetical protein ACOZ4I_11430 [Haloarcula salina]|uniref:hypothetical protein n=1 Tax=Haloarcula salina TaxID=1429914 RepID=UPI003C70523B
MAPTIHTHTQHRPTTERTASRRVGAFRDDGRGVSEVLGAILLFGLLMTLLVLIQVNAVPAQNQQIEFEHNQRAQQDMLSVDRAILQAGTENVPASTQVEVATRYPSRFFLVNPGVGAGSIATTEPGTVTVSNAVAPSASTYWNGDDRTFETRRLRYRPNYNEYRNAPVTVYEHNTLVNTFDNGAVRPVDSGSFVDGDQLLLVFLDGQLATSSTNAIAVETTPLSGPSQSVTITNGTDSGIAVSLPTALTEDQWRGLLEDETVANGGRVSAISVAPGTPHNTLTVTLEPGTYQLRMARVGVGGSIDESALGPHYLTTDDEAFGESIRTDESRAVTVDVRDRFNNPATGDVTFTSADGSFRKADGTTADSLTKSSDERGAVTAVFVPASGFTGTAVVTASQDFDGDSTVQSWERTQFSIPVEQSGDDESTDSVSGVNPYFAESVRLESVRRQGPNGVSIDFYNNGSTDREIRQVRLLFYSSNSGNPADWGKLNDDDDDQFYRFGNWEPVDQSIVIESKQTETVSITFDRAGTQDFFGLAVEYNGLSANYFVQVP